MIANLWNILCKDIVTDQVTNAVSYLQCIEGLSTAKLPADLPAINLGTLWLIEPDKSKQIKFRMRLTIERPDGSKQKLLETPEKVYAQKKRERINFQLVGMPIKSEGIHKFIIEYSDGKEWNISNDILLEISLIKKKKQSKN